MQIFVVLHAVVSSSNGYKKRRNVTQFKFLMKERAKKYFFFILLQHYKLTATCDWNFFYRVLNYKQLRKFCLLLMLKGLEDLFTKFKFYLDNFQRNFIRKMTSISHKSNSYKNIIKPSISLKPAISKLIK